MRVIAHFTFIKYIYVKAYNSSNLKALTHSFFEIINWAAILSYHT